MNAREKTLNTEQKVVEQKKQKVVEQKVVEQKKQKVVKGSKDALEWGMKMKKLREEKKQKK